MNRLARWGVLAIAALVATGAARAARLADAAGRQQTTYPAPRSCSPGPVTEGEFGEAPGGGYLRFDYADTGEYREFYFIRGIYSEGGGRGFYGFGFGGRRGGRGGWELGDGGPSWSIDYANADRHIVQVTRQLSNIDACQWEHPVSFADPDLRRFPFVYSLEWGRGAELTEAEVEGLRGYLEAGGFLMIDDFWGSYEWENFEAQIRRVLPGRSIVEVPRDHLLFHIHYTIDGEIIQVPGFGGGFRGRGTSQQDGYTPHVRGIFDDEGRLMVVINFNTDLGDALEHAENPYYPLYFSTFASELFLNMIMYSMTS
jgi:hypothetical protein